MKLKYLKSEQLKFWSNRWLILAALASVAGIPILTAVLNASSRAARFDFIANQLLQSLYLGQAGLVVISGLYFGQEFLKSALRTSLLCMPGRLKFMAVKLLNLAIWTILCLLASTALAAAVIPARFSFELPFETLLSLLTLLAPAWLSAIQLSLMAAGLAVLSGSVILPLAVLLSLILGLGSLLMSFGSWPRFLPVLSVMNSFSTAHTAVYPGIEAGLILQGGWCVGILVAGYCRLSKKRVV